MHRVPGSAVHTSVTFYRRSLFTFLSLKFFSNRLEMFDGFTFYSYNNMKSAWHGYYYLHGLANMKSAWHGESGRLDSQTGSAEWRFDSV